MRYYGSEYAKSLTDSITRAKGSVDSTGYSSVISSTTVKSGYSGLKSECIGAANRAYGNVSNVRDKLGTLNTKLTSFYNEVDSTAEEVNNTALTVKQVLSSINTSLKNMHDLLGGTGSFKGKTATADSINAACSSLASGADALTKHYAKKFTNSDGTLNMDAVKEFCDKYDIKIEEGLELKDTYVVSGFVEATENYLKNCSDEEAAAVANDLMKIFYVQDKDTLSTWHSDSRDNWEYGKDGEMHPVVWFNYKFRPSAELFTAFYDQKTQAQIASKGLTGYYDSNKNALRFRDVLLVTANEFKYISCPVFADDKDYQKFREENFDRSGGTTDDSVPISDIPTTNDNKYVSMPFNGFRFSIVHDDSVPGQEVDYVRMTFDGFGDAEKYLGFNTLNYNGEYYDISGGAYSVDICSCNPFMIDYTKRRIFGNAYAYAESNRVSMDEVFAQSAFDITAGLFFKVMGVGNIPGFDIVWGFMGNAQAAAYANQDVTEYQAGLTKDAQTFNYYTNLGGVTGSYYIIDNEKLGPDDQCMPVVITITSDPAWTQIILGYNSAKSDHLVVVGTEEADKWLNERDLDTDSQAFIEYQTSFIAYLTKKGVNYKALSREQLADYIREFNKSYF